MFFKLLPKKHRIITKKDILDKFFEFQIFLSKGASYRFKSPDPFLPLETDHPTEQHPLVAMVDTQGSNVKPTIRRLRLKLHEANKTIRCFSLLFSARSWDDVHMYIYICIIHTYILYTIYIVYIYILVYIYIYVVKPASWRTFFRPGFFGGSKEVKIVTLLGGLSHLVGG